MQNKMKTNAIPKFMFVLGAVVDCGIAVSWFLIASGWDFPNILNGYTGTGQDYQLAMYVAAMFMSGWTVLLGWGALQPIERRDLGIENLVDEILHMIRWNPVVQAG